MIHISSRINHFATLGLLAGFRGFGNNRAALSWGFKVRTFGHVFTIIATNNQNFTPARYGVNAESNDFVLGFNIYRRR